MSTATPSNSLSLELDASDTFDVREFTVEDGLQTLFSVDIVAVCPNPAVDFEKTVGRQATFRIQGGTGVSGNTEAPLWSGVVSEVHQLRAEDTGLSTYHLTIVPRLWLLTQRVNCRVFQQLSDLDIGLHILREWGIVPAVETSRSYKTRKYRVQYQETDYAFLCRLLEAAGVTFFFRRAEEGSTLVLSDAPERGRERAAPLDHVNQQMGGGTITATAFQASRAIRSGRVTLADHDHRLPNAPLLAEAQANPASVEAELEHFVYAPGAFRYGTKGTKDTPFADDRGRTRTDPDEAKRLAEQTACALVARTRRFSFDSNALDLAPGLLLKIANHSLAEREGKLLITRTSISGTAHTEPSVSCGAVSASTPFRPEAVTPTPSIFGVECATVVGPAGETIHCDEFGRVRVQFHWDRYGKMDEYSSCWMPVNQPWAGDALGALQLPRVGQEVIVSFLGGNPEEPIVVGRLFTNLLRPPFPMPQNKTQSGFKSASVPATGGYNELMFEDAAGRELLRMRAERDMNTRVNNNQDLSVGQHRTASIEGNDKEQVTGNQNHDVLGQLVSSIGGQMLSSVGGDQLMSVLGSLVSSAGGERLLQTIGNYVSQALTHQITSQQGTTISVGQSMIHIGPDSIIIQSPKVLLNPGEEVAANASMGGTTPSPSQ
ncbi:MAG TPA: type VI secretion system tip protein TssI/VgrG [Polyangiaceae bacterium]|nr:type VI secretion system tip protein TssI/VgrG [Polyangiaceae bacterium]